jgi:hypothetical protein
VPAVPKPDAICLAAVDEARAAAVHEAGEAGHVGEPVGHEAEGERTLTHLFACLSPGYRGWRWAVTLTRVPRARSVTVSEVVLLPGPDALLAPVWVPWSERVAPGDLSPGAILPTDPDDPRLEPGYASVRIAASALDEPAEAVADLVGDLGLVRARVLSVAGQDEAAERWYSSDAGPRGEQAVAAALPCRTCGFLVPLAGPLSALFGVCANAMAPDDGSVVSVDHGCGAHSQVPAPAQGSRPAVLVYESADVALPF